MPMKMPLTKRQIQFYASLYNRAYPSKNRKMENIIKKNMNNVTTRGYMTRKELWLVAKWKSPRKANFACCNEEDDVECITRDAFASGVSIGNRISMLCELSGVRHPTASVILHFRFPDCYPIIDVKVMEMVGGTTRYKPETLEEYVALCKRTAQRHRLKIRDVEKALWKCHQVHGGNIKRLNEWHKRYIR